MITERRASVNLPCIVCGKRMKNYGSDGHNQPYARTAFTSHGHYGSTAFDPMDGTFIEINLCDPCLRFRARDGFIATGQDNRHIRDTAGNIIGMELIPQAEREVLKLWNPDKEQA